jgi:chorismate synthase
VYGIEIVAFVSSVGKIHLPSTIAPPSLVPSDDGEENDEVQDALSEDFRKLIATITREEVDKYTTRCPHPETSERMTEVHQLHKSCVDYSPSIHSESSGQRMPRTLSVEP